MNFLRMQRAQGDLGHFLSDGLAVQKRCTALFPTDRPLVPRPAPVPDQTRDYPRSPRARKLAAHRIDWLPYPWASRPLAGISGPAIVTSETASAGVRPHPMSLKTDRSEVGPCPCPCARRLARSRQEVDHSPRAIACPDRLREAKARERAPPCHLVDRADR